MFEEIILGERIEIKELINFKQWIIDSKILKIC